VYAVEFSHRSGRDLVNLAKKRTNIIPIVEDARHPQKYRMLVGMVDVVFSDVAQPDQARIVALNSQYFLKNGGHFVISIKANCIDSVAAPEAVFAREVAKLKEDGFKPREQLTLEPYERDHAVVRARRLRSRLRRSDAVILTRESVRVRVFVLLDVRLRLHLFRSSVYIVQPRRKSKAKHPRSHSLQTSHEPAVVFISHNQSFIHSNPKLKLEMDGDRNRSINRVSLAFPLRSGSSEP